MSVPTPGTEAPVPIPEGLAEMAPGPQLAQVLAEIPFVQVSGHDTVEVLRAAYRLATHYRTVFLAALLETGLREPFSHDSVARVETPGEFASEEARAALSWSRTRASSTFSLAFDVLDRLPMLGEAMLAGELDESRARAFLSWTEGLTDEQAAQVCGQLLPEAPGLTVGELIDRIKRLAIAIDPEWAERRYKEKVRGRRVAGSRNPDGTGNLYGLDLPIDRAVAAGDRVDTLARDCKRGGDRRPVNHVKTDLFLGMLDGTFLGMTDAQIVAYVLEHPFADPGDDGDPGSDGRGSNDGEVRAGDDGGGGGDDDGDDGDDGDGGDGDGGDGRDGGDGGGGPDRGTPTGSGSGDAARAQDDPQRPVPEKPTAEPTGDPAGGHDAGSGAPREVAARWAVRELRAPLAALLGLNEHPAQLPGWDYVPAWLARQMVARMAAGEWRYVVCDALGRPVHAGLLAARPCSPGERPPLRDSRRGGIVEVQVTTVDLERLATRPHEHGRWAAVIAELAATHAEHLAGRTVGEHGEHGRDGGAGGAGGDGAASRRRTPGAWLRRQVQLRDRCCVHPACRVPAARTDQDHAVGYAEGGLTVGPNLSCCCRHDHRLQEAGWRVAKPAPEVTVWTSPLGHRYTSRPPPLVLRLPEPVPRGLPDGPDSPDVFDRPRSEHEADEPTMPPPTDVRDKPGRGGVGKAPSPGLLALLRIPLRDMPNFDPHDVPPF